MVFKLTDAEHQLMGEFPLPEPYLWKIKGLSASDDDGFYMEGGFVTVGIARPVTFLGVWYPYASRTVVEMVDPRKGMNEFRSAAKIIYTHPASRIDQLLAKLKDTPIVE